MRDINDIDSINYLIAICTITLEKTITDRGSWVHIYMSIRTLFVWAQSCHKISLEHWSWWDNQVQTEYSTLTLHKIRTILHPFWNDLEGKTRKKKTSFHNIAYGGHRIKYLEINWVNNTPYELTCNWCWSMNHSKTWCRQQF